MRKIFSILIVVLLVLHCAPSGWTMMLKLSFEDLTQKAENIIIGKVTKKECHYDEVGEKIYTYVTISVEEDLKGEVEEREITIRHLGGKVGEIGLWVEDTPSFEEDEEVLVFLRKSNTSKFKEVVGQMQGKFRIERDEITGERAVIETVRSKRKGTRLSEFKKEIIKILKSTKDRSQSKRDLLYNKCIQMYAKSIQGQCRRQSSWATITSCLSKSEAFRLGSPLPSRGG